jgi:DNA modification methylase
MTVKILNGDCIEMMKTLPDRSVNCCVTSPPYFGLRDYGHEGQIGLEETPEAFVQKMVEVFREVNRVLRDDGTLWLNIGDSYASMQRSGKKESPGVGAKQEMPPIRTKIRWGKGGGTNFFWRIPTEEYGDIKPKDLIGIPWMLAFALRADGWYLRQDIIWHKPNPMPESVTDRCTKAHEYIFLLSKSARYFYDAEAIKEPSASSSIARLSQPNLESQVGSARVPGKTNGNMKAVGGEMRNPRSVWTVNTQPYKAAHFATFPLNLIRPCILAGCPTDGTVLDPFGGSGTTGQVAMEEGRKSILCELNPEYVQLMNQRLNGVTPSLWSQPMEALK